MLAGCDAGSSGIPGAISATKEVIATGYTVASGKITLTLGTGIGSGVDSSTITFNPAVGTGTVTWCNGTSATNTAAQAQ